MIRSQILVAGEEVVTALGSEVDRLEKEIRSSFRAFGMSILRLIILLGQPHESQGSLSFLLISLRFVNIMAAF